MSKAAVIFKIMLLLQTRNIISASELSSILETSVRNIRAYIEDMRTAGVPVEYKSGRNGGYYLAEDYYFRPQQIDSEEFTALLLAERFLTRENGFVFEKGLKTAVAKIKAATNNREKSLMLPDNISVCFGKMDNHETLKDIFEKINYAIIERFTLDIVYYSQSRGECSQRKIDPYYLLYREGAWYLIGYCHIRDKILIFKVSRIQHLVITTDKFIYPKDFSIQNYMADSMGLIRGDEEIVEVRFYQPSSRWVEEKEWLPTQTIRKLKDGSIIFTARVKGLIEIKKWILGFGKDAEVIKPLKLREEIIKEVEEMRGRY